MTIYVGSARIDERGQPSGGQAGDQKQTSNTFDTKGEVSQQVMYTSSKGWYILRPKDIEVANKMACLMVVACNNANLGYDQNQRLGVIKNGIKSAVKTECDCSSLVRACVKEATGKDPGNFATVNEKAVLLASGLFNDKGKYASQLKTPVYNGDVLVTCTSGHTVIVTSGNARVGNISSSTTKKESYDSWVASLQKLIGAKVDGIWGSETLSKCPTLSKGSKGDIVKLVQQRLNSVGFNLVCDGDFGTNTHAAVKKFQTNRKLTADGVIGKNTWTWLLKGTVM